MARKSRKYGQSVQRPAIENESRQFSAALYVRLSNEERAERANRDSFKNQKAFLLDFVEKHPEITVYKIYEDNGSTGTNFDRPAFSDMMYDVSNEKVNCIIVKDLSRFGREYVETGKYLDYLFPMIGLRFIAINDNYDTYDKVKNSDMIVPFKNIINAVYSKDISRKVISSLTLKQHKGEFLGNYAPYGFNLDKNRCFVPDEYAAGIVNRMADMYIECEAFSRVAKTLTKEGIDTPAVYRYKQGLIKSEKIIGSNIWNTSVVKSILTNPANLGHMVQGKTKSLFLETGEKKNTAVDRKSWIIVENTHPAIMTQEKYDKIIEIVESKERPGKKTSKFENIFRSKLVCGECGRPLSMRRRKKWQFYVCNLHEKCSDKCDFMSINYKVLSEAVFKSIKAYILTMLDFEKSITNVSNSYQIRLKKQGFESSIRKLNSSLNAVKKQRFDLFRDYIEELIEGDEFNFARENYTAEIEMLQDRLRAEEEEYKRFQNALEPFGWRERFKKYRSARNLTREMVEYFIDKITVGKDKSIEIKWRFTQKQLMEMEDIA